MSRHKLVQDTVTMGDANTQVSYDIPIGARQVLIKLRSGTAKLKYYLVSGDLSKTSTLAAGQSRNFSDVIFAEFTMYFQSPSASQVLEIEYIINQ